uniref:F-box domain-containing protein n=1 Tax=Ditylum brightwellii TaxID=49249 RepID=A0A7S1ZIW1_9STRA|mmetsp:Transcript_32918/g.49042  ORF Transcript_32918/g.49042 Transcript_32918/m.49042 type:complete len:325 (+) Transcript_32918:90-1064(+)
MSPNTTIPSLPPLYFHEKNGYKDTKIENSENMISLESLPAELTRHCISSFCAWGDLAKLATVQKSWANIMKDAAEHGGKKAKWELANALMDGTNGLESNPTLAVEYFSELAGVTINENEESESDEQDEAGDIIVLEPSPCHDEVVESEDVYVPAMRKLATCNLTGHGVPHNNSAGLKWLETAYKIGNDVDAAHELALIYEYAQHGVEIDVVVAAQWFKQAAESGHVEAMAEYAMCCELGCGREQSDEDALEWYIKAAESGHTTSKFSVGEAFEEARGVPQSDEEACLWYYKAAVEGDEDSKRALRRLRDIARIVVPGLANLLNE